MTTLRLATCAVAAIVAACSAESVEPPMPPPVGVLTARVVVDAGPVATARERGLAAAYLDALASRGFERLSAVLEDQTHFVFAGRGDVRGRDAVVRAHAALLGSFDDRRFTAMRVLLTDSSQVVQWMMSGVDTATHQPVQLRGVVLLWTRDDGSLSDVHLYFDRVTEAGEPVQPAQVFEPSGADDERTNGAALRATIDALEAGNEAAYLAPLADDVAITLPDLAKPLRGRAEAQKLFRATRARLAHLDTTVDNVWAAGPLVVVEYHLVGEQRARQDALVTEFVVDVAERAGGKIARIWRYDGSQRIPDISP